MKFNVNRVDNMVIQAIFLLDTLDKDINSFSMRVRFVLFLMISYYSSNDTTIVCVHILVLERF